MLSSIDSSLVYVDRSDVQASDELEVEVDEMVAVEDVVEVDDAVLLEADLGGIVGESMLKLPRLSGEGLIELRQELDGEPEQAFNNDDDDGGEELVEELVVVVVVVAASGASELEDVVVIVADALTLAGRPLEAVRCS